MRFLCLSVMLSASLLVFIPRSLAQNPAIQETQPPRISTKHLSAYNKLLKTDTFSLGGVGVAGVRSEEEKAFRDLLASPKSVAVFTALRERAQPAGQSYALLGLWLKDQKAFLKAKPGFNATASIKVLNGCLVTVETGQALLDKIESNAYSGHFTH